MSGSLRLMVMEYMKSSGGCATTATVARRFGISKTQASNVLRALARAGLACAAVDDSTYKIYCLRGVEVEDVFAVVPCFQHLREALARIAEGHRGKVALISVASLAAALAERCRAPMNELLFPARAYLDAAVAPHAVSVSHGGKYVVPIEVLRQFAESPPKVPAKCPRVLVVWHRRPRIRMAITTVKVPAETLEALDRIAAARNTLRSIIIREALAEYVERHAAEAYKAAAGGTPMDDGDFLAIQGRT